MQKNLVIVESPAKAKTIEKFLGDDFKVMSSYGHIRDLKKKELSIDIDSLKPDYEIPAEKEKVVRELKQNAKNAEKVWLASDEDREGEAISWHLCEVLGLDEQKTNRIVFHEITKPAILEAIKNPRHLDMNLVNAQQARRVLDRLVGFKLSPVLWRKVKPSLSAGRVQSVAVRLIVEREKEIRNFKSEAFYRIYGTFAVTNSDGSQSEVKAEVPTRFKTHGEVVAFLKRCEQSEFSIESISKKPLKRSPAPPFTTSTLQQEAARKLGFSVSQTMMVAQHLYESGRITYMRTDSVNLSELCLKASREEIMKTWGEEYSKTRQYHTQAKCAQEAHEAIRPTDVSRVPESIKDSLTRDQFKLYKLVYSRFVSSQMTPAVYDTLSVDIAGGPVVMRFTGTRKKFAGFTVVYEESVDDEVEEKDVRLPDITEGMELELTDAQGDQRFTQPPPRYTEASLVRELEEKGIGRPSTYAPTITTIIARGYIARENRRLMPTELGTIVTDLMKQYFSNIVDLTFTANMEEELDEVEEGKRDWHAVIGEFYGPFSETLENAEKNMEKVQIVDQVSDVVCDKCGAMMVYKMGRYGKFLACPNFPECRNTKALLKEIDAPCPKCGGKLLERMSHKGRKFYGCEHYPDCDFVSWDMPVREKCPLCGSMMVMKRGRKGAAAHVCTNETCRHRVEIAPGEGEEE